MDFFELGAMPLGEILRRSGIPGSGVDEVYWGAGDTSVCKDVYTPVPARKTLVKAGNAPGLNDGATAILFMTLGRAEELGLEPLADIVAMSSIALRPERMLEGPAVAARKALQRADLTLG